jgi:hypothetical protein
VIIRKIPPNRGRGIASYGWVELPENRSFTVTESARRREILLAALVAALPIELAETASATPLNPEQTIIRLPAQLQWKSNPSQ